ncbi:MAG: 6-hydroxymethylpterin diphosphokinase MptE-like protein [Thermodesulfobacteriota bacterium]
MPAPAAAGPHWEANLALVAQHHPHLLPFLAKAPSAADPVEVSTFPSASGCVTARALDRSSGRQVLLHSDQDPRAEARTLADSLQLKGGELRCLVGLGMGYLALEIAGRQLPLHRLLVVEPSPEILAAAMAQVDLAPLLTADGMTILAGTEHALQGYFEANQLALSLHGVFITTFEPSRELLPEATTLLNRRLREAGQSILGQITTMQHVGRQTLDNLMANCTDVLAAANLGSLMGTFSDRPAVIVGAGPSLNEALPTLACWQHRVLVVAVDSALPVLLKAGIRPHLVTTVDFSGACVDKFRDVLDQAREVPLCFVHAVNPLAVKLYPSPVKFFLAPTVGFLADMKDLWGGVWLPHPPMQGVAHLAYTAAAISGARPLVLLGFDLAYTGLRSHAQGMAIPVSLNLDDAPWVEGLDGAMLPTMFQMLGMRAGIEQLIRIFQVPCLNANRQGARIQGAESCDLASFLAALPEPDQEAAARVADRFQQARKPQADEVIVMLRGKRQGLAAALTACRQSSRQAEKVERLLEQDPFAEERPRPKTLAAVERTLTDYEAAMAAIQAAGVQDVDHLLSGSNLDLQAEEARLVIDQGDSPARAKVLREMRLITQAMEHRLEALRVVDDALARLLRRLTEAQRLQRLLAESPSAAGQAKALAELGRVYLDYGDLLLAEGVLRQSLARREANGEAHYQLGQALSRAGRHQEALPHLKRAASLAPYRKIRDALAVELAWPERTLAKARSYVTSTGPGYVRLPWALRLCRQIASAYPEHQGARELLAKVEADLAVQEEAVSGMAQLLAGSEEEALARLDHLQAGGERERALRLANILIRKYPRSAPAKERLALLQLEGEGQEEQAESLLVQAVSLAPDRPEPRIHLAALLANKGQHAEALAYLAAALSLDPTSLAFLHEAMGDLARRLGDPTTAIGHYEAFFLAHPQRRDVLGRLGDCYQALGKTEAAAAAWQAAAGRPA